MSDDTVSTCPVYGQYAANNTHDCLGVTMGSGSAPIVPPAPAARIVTVRTYEQVCPLCCGRGWYPDELAPTTQRKCPRCDGRHTITGTETTYV
jgi:DnaJ-class molecular chaperone